MKGNSGELGGDGGREWETDNAGPRAGPVRDGAELRTTAELQSVPEHVRSH